MPSVACTEILASWRVPRCTRVCIHAHSANLLDPQMPCLYACHVASGRKPRCQAWTTREGPGLLPWGLLFVQLVPRHLSPAGLFSSLSTGGEVPFEAQQVWNPSGRDAGTLVFLSQAYDLTNS